MTAKVLPLRPAARTLATARLRRALLESGLTQERAGELLRLQDGARQIRRWLSGKVSLGPLELVCLLEERSQRRAA